MSSEQESTFENERPSEPTSRVNPQSATHNLQSPIDLLLVGLPHPHLEREALARLRQWARLGERYRVVSAQGNREEIARQIGQARVVLVRRGQRDAEWVLDCARQAGATVMAEEEASPRDLEQLLGQKKGTRTVSARFQEVSGGADGRKRSASPFSAFFCLRGGSLH